MKIFNKHDNGYKMFVDFCENHSSSYLPIFKGKILSIPNTNYDAIRMEKLNKLKKNNKQDVEFINMIDRIADRLQNPASTLSTEEIKTLTNKCQTKHSSLYKILFHCKQYFVLYGNDIHIKNVMKRKDGQHVIIDPF